VGQAVCNTEGIAVGYEDGSEVGTQGLFVGRDVGTDVGREGRLVGASSGAVSVGLPVGWVGSQVGWPVGIPDG